MAEIKDIIGQFKKAELLGIVAELGLTIQSGEQTTKIIKAILADLDENGVPVITGKGACSDTCAEFLLVAGLIDEAGNVIELESAKEEGQQSESKPKADEPIKLPPCFSFADPGDPSCNRCAVFAMCKLEVIKLRPPCYGTDFDASAVECKGCFYAQTCRLVKH